MNGSPDPLDSFPRLRVRQSDATSRRSSFGADSELERYCSANSVMGTPNTSMSMCSAVTVFHDFSDLDFGSSRSFDDGNSRKNFRYGSSGLELYGDGDEGDDLGIDSSELIGNKRSEESDGKGNEGEVGGREIGIEMEEDEEFSDGDDSMFNYGSGCEGDNENEKEKNEFYSSRRVHLYEDKEVRNENPLFMNSSVAFGSHDLDDFLIENGLVSVEEDLFQNPRENDNRVEENEVSSRQKEEKNEVIVNDEVEETKNISDREALMEVRDRERNIPVACNEVQGADELVDCFKMDDLGLLPEEDPQESLNITDVGSEGKGNRHIDSDETGTSGDAQRENPELFSRVDVSSSNVSVHVGNVNGKSFENLKAIVLPSNGGTRKTLERISTSTNVLEKSHVISKIEDSELNEFYDEVVQDMEEILLESRDSNAARFSMGNRMLDPLVSMPSRDGGLTASTSGADDAYLLVQRPRRIDRIEVVGARQKTGDVSFSERLVGVKEYTVYKIKVWSGKDQWEVEKRYRDFLTLHRCMKTLFNEQGWTLPLPWSSVEKESKIFRSASLDIIAKRSVLIQECLQSILSSRFFSSPPRALVWFLSPEDSHLSSPVSNSPVSLSSFTRGENIQNFSTWGKTISLIVEIPSNKSTRQLLEAQHHRCAGCHKHFDDGNTSIWDFVQTFGWGKPRLCEYTGQLFCSSCHTNETAVLPARVLHHWDFTHYPVSQLAKSYLDSIHEHPMLCVTAVNPFLLSKVPALLHVMNVRKRIGTMLPYVRCPFRRSINRGVGNRRYLLESNDFFALRDLIDLSKGVFAALPVMVETVSRKILEHITDQCLVCCDVGNPCSARQDCSDPSSLIFPFQEDDIERCKSCQSVFHKPCFKKLVSCPCGEQLRLNKTRSLSNRASQWGGLGKGLSSGLSPKFLSGLFSKEKTREQQGENIILMGSLPSNSL
ncbi:uncharacterized protein LOC131639953 isoform X1 [Vicia villosa]|uniref:uncharacterized protein LOC131639953 isoform X1 n=1 Tax=Vicia villosa TaxID=3911 RepID=UPI00273CADF5|nr:uncharacterized protein LOC131639953 isoform X1 [Vicia villosa]